MKDNLQYRQALLKTIIEELFYKRGAVSQIYGKVKTGKTDFACLLANQAVHLGLFKGVITNIKDCPNTWTFVKNTKQVWEEVKRGRDKKIPRLLVLDEADGFLSPMRHGSKRNEMMAKVLWQAGKCYVQTLAITHRSKDLDTRIRWLKHTLLIKQGKRKLSWETDLKPLKEMKKHLIQEESWPIQVPQTHASFDPDAIASMEYKPHSDFEKEEEEENERNVNFF